MPLYLRLLPTGTVRRRKGNFFRQNPILKIDAYPIKWTKAAKIGFVIRFLRKIWISRFFLRKKIVDPQSLFWPPKAVKNATIYLSHFWKISKNFPFLTPIFGHFWLKDAHFSPLNRSPVDSKFLPMPRISVWQITTMTERGVDHIKKWASLPYFFEEQFPTFHMKANFGQFCLQNDKIDLFQGQKWRDFWPWKNFQNLNKSKSKYSGKHRT